MDTMDAIFSRRSVRAFKRESLPEGLPQQILSAAVAAPSGGNMQAWGFVLVQSTEQVKALRSLAPGIIDQPAAVIAVCLDEERAIRLGGSSGGQTAWMSLGMAVENILLAAHALGVGACPVASFHAAAVSSFLELPDHIQLVLLVTLGYPRWPAPSPGRRSISELCFDEKWGAAADE